MSLPRGSEPSRHRRRSWCSVQGAPRGKQPRGKPTLRRKPHPGAPPGNKNNLKHGLYAKHYVPQSRLALDSMPPLESLPEIYMLRAQLDDILTLIANCDDEDRRIKLYNALFTGAHRLSSAMRTHSILVGKDQELLTTFWEALDLFRKERGL
jgi:hypothetical protein